MAFSVLAQLASSKLFIDIAYFKMIAQRQLVGGGFKLPRLNLLPSSRTSSTDRPLITSVIDDIASGDEVLLYHPVHGPIFAQDYGPNYFSTERFINNLHTGEESPNVIGHFMHICSGGGEAWLLDRAAEAMRKCRKPIYAFIEMMSCSAAYYLASNAQVVKAYTQNDTIGSIGTMISFWNIDGYFENLGLKYIEEYASKSDLKNKKVNDLIAGNPEQYIREELDPLQQQFEREIRQAREQLAELPEDDPVVRGETFSATVAVQKGLIDGIIDKPGAIQEAYELGITIKSNNNILNEL